MGKTSSRAARDADTERVERLLVIEKATDVPKMDATSESDPYVEVRALDAAGEKIGDKVRTLSRQDNPNPVWNAYRKVVVSPNGTLQFKLFDEDTVTKDDLIGSKVSLKVSEITLGETVEVPITDSCKLFFRMEELEASTSKAITKTIICIRHGESLWNEAQEHLALVDMYKQRDHPLNETGMKQALALNASWKALKSGEKKPADEGMSQQQFDAFQGAEAIFASPLCRASQTCILGLLGHPTLMKTSGRGGINLMSTLRESKKIGGLDTAANTLGEDIRTRVEATIVATYPELKEQFEPIQWDFNDTYEKWWTETYDGKDEILARFHDTFQFLRYIPEKTVILVGHSLFFQAFFRNYLATTDASSEELGLDEMVVGDEKDEEKDDEKDGDEEADGEAIEAPVEKAALYRELKKRKLMNAGCALCSVHFADDLKKGFEIQEVDLLFGTKLV